MAGRSDDRPPAARFFRPSRASRRAGIAAALPMAALPVAAIPSLAAIPVAAIPLAALLIAPDAAQAQSAAAGSAVTLDEVVVEGTAGQGAEGAAANGTSAGRSSAVTPEAEARRRLEATPGATAVVGAGQLVGKADVTIADALNSVPGIIASAFLGGNDQPKIHIRGSGLQTNPTERGLLMLQDGLPINRADGSYVVGLIDARLADFIEVFRGYTGNRLGAQTLGGALNFVSPTGSQKPGVEIDAEAGSFGYAMTTASAGTRQGNLDAFGQVSYSTRDGYRDWNDSQRTNVAFNAGAKLSDTVSTRAFFAYTDLGFQVPGPLSRQLFETDPTQAAPGLIPGINAGPNSVRDQPRRDTAQTRGGSRTTATFGDSLFDVAFGYAWTDDTFRFPIGTGYRDTTGGDFTTTLRYAYQPDKSAALPLFEANALYVVGAAGRDYFINNQGAQSLQYGSSDFDAASLSVGAGFNLPVGAFTLSPAIAYQRATRDNEDTYDLSTRPRLVYNQNTGKWIWSTRPATDTSFSRAYDAWTPSLGLSWHPAEGQTMFASMSRSFEAPTFDDLLEPTGGGPNASPIGFLTPDLKAQTATTAEAGWRGSAGRLDWDVVTYYSWLDNELIRTTDGSTASTVNADKTSHFGIELGGRLQITDRLAARLAYTFQDFEFDHDPVYGDNQIAGAPRHYVIAALRYAITAPWWVEGEVQWTPQAIPIDNANTFYSDPYAVVNVRTNYAVSPGFSVYGEVRNLFDIDYAGATLVLGRVTQPFQAVFLPGDGRAFYAGTRVRF
ncbi:TonB-dependent receptor family protein [Blastochloris sulfoviridis]|nr:TonB-dependent receptor [Blastochloris sulfoviridis]